MSGVNGHGTLARLEVHGPNHNAGLVVQYVVVALDGLGRKELSSHLTVLTPIPTVSTTMRAKKTWNLPKLAVGRRGNSTSLQDSLVLDEVLLTTGEDGTMVDEEFAGDVRVGDDNIELVAYVEGVEGTIFLRPCIKLEFRVVGEGGISHKRTGRYCVTIFIDDVFAEEQRKDEVHSCSTKENQGEVYIKVL